MDLIIKNKVIDTPLIIILNELKSELCSNLLKVIKDRGDNIQVTCPFHKHGEEKKPSASLYCGDDKEVEYGTFNCFTCHTVCSLAEFIGHCFGEDKEYGENWLYNKFGNTVVFSDHVFNLDKIELENNKTVKQEKNTLDNLDFTIGYHPYMQKRKITEEIANKFGLGYTDNSIVFPLCDSKGNSIGYSERSIYNKYFNIQVGENKKPVYLLDEVIKENTGWAIVTEAQIDALTSWSYGKPAVAFMGTGSKEQYEQINKSGITLWVCMFDNDDAGRKATKLFRKNIRKDIIVAVPKMPKGCKDINDMTKEQFEETLNSLYLV